MRRLIGLLIAFLLLLPALAEACPTCSDSVSQNGANLAEGYYYSILFMIGSVLTVVSTLIGYLLYLGMGEEEETLEAENPASSPEPEDCLVA